MKLLNYTAAYFVAIILVILSVWAVIFYFVMLDEIYDSIDDGLDNQKGLVIQKAASDSSVLYKNNFDETDYAIREVPSGNAIDFYDTYKDTMMYMQNENSDEPVRLLTTMFLHNGKYYQLQVATSMVEEDDLIKQLFYSILWLFLGLVATIIIFNNFLLKRIWKPFYQLLRQLKKFRVDKNPTITVEKTKVAEFNMLNETVEGMAKRNVETYNSQKQFIENAAHELQTPLAISINKLETLAENNDLKPEQLKIVSGILDDLERLTRLNRSLLLLSRIENKQFADETQVDINALVKQITTDFKDQLNFSNIGISLRENGHCLIHMNEDLAAILITNLVKNAIVHNIPGGFVHLTIAAGYVSVENSGATTLLDEKQIFDRFHTGQSSGASTGLGLAIVKAITTLYHFRIQYRYTQHHMIRIDF